MSDGPDEGKRCARCALAKPRDAFTGSPRNRDGLHSWCRECVAEYGRSYRADPDVQRRRKTTTDAYTHALGLLRELHRDEFDLIYEIVLKTYRERGTGGAALAVMVQDCVPHGGECVQHPFGRVLT